MAPYGKEVLEALQLGFLDEYTYKDNFLPMKWRGDDCDTSGQGRSQARDRQLVVYGPRWGHREAPAVCIGEGAKGGRAMARSKSTTPASRGRIRRSRTSNAASSGWMGRRRGPRRSTGDEVRGARDDLLRCRVRRDQRPLDRRRRLPAIPLKGGFCKLREGGDGTNLARMSQGLTCDTAGFRQQCEAAVFFMPTKRSTLVM